MKRAAEAAKPARSYVISLENRKARGSGHERLEEILAAARALFLEHGIENVSTRQLATRVGISQTALYVYFKNKEQMLDKLVEGAFRKLGETMKALEARSVGPLDYLTQALPAYVRFGVENPDEYRLAFLLRDGRSKVSILPQDERQTIGTRVFGVLEQRIAEGLAAGQLRSSNASPRAVAQAVWAAIHGLVALLLAYPDFDWVEFEALLSAHTDMILHGLLAQPLPAKTLSSKRRANAKP